MKVPFLLVLLRTKVERLKPEKNFLILACSFGLAVALANAPFQAPDENDHFFRVYQLSEGTLIGEKRGNTAGGELPKALVDGTNTDGIPFHYTKKMTYELFLRLLHPVFVDWSRAPRAYHEFPHTVVYSAVGYVPQTIAVYFGRLLRIGPIGLMYLARFAGLAASVAFGYAALRALPIYRWTTLVLLLCPMSLYLFGSIASDGMLITVGALLAARLARLAIQEDKKIGKCEQTVLLSLAAVLAIAKPVYLPLSGVVVFVVYPRLGSSRSRALFCAASVLFCVLPTWLWTRVALALFVPGKGIPLDPVLQSHYILASPLEFLGLVAHTIRGEYIYNFRWMIGTLGWGDTPMPGWFYTVFLCGILGCLILESDKSRRVTWQLRIVVVTSVAISVLLIYAAQYASWNSPGSHSPIEGIEGRYFLPLLPLLVLGFPAIQIRMPSSLVVALACLLAVLCALICLWAVVLRYYVAAVSPFSEGAARLTKISARALVGSKGNTLIAGFIVNGDGTEKLLIRAAGPSLQRLGIKGAIADPTVSIMGSNGALIASNTRWETNLNPERISAATITVGAAQLPSNSGDSALVVSLPAGSYSVRVSSANGTRGIAEAEVFEISGDECRLANFSARGYVGRGGNAMVVELVTRGKGAEKLLCRVVGPSLKQFGIDGVLSKPTLEISRLRNGDMINTGWGTSSAKTEISATAKSVGAFPVPEGSDDSAAVFSVPPGAYTIKAYGADGTTGVALAEVYEVP